jgi:hypothetical protein
MIDDFSAESDKLVKGLEAYLRKEAKAIAALAEKSEAEMAGRREKWTKVLEKVQDKLNTAAVDARNRVRNWFIGVRDIEIREVGSLLFPLYTSR